MYKSSVVVIFISCFCIGTAQKDIIQSDKLDKLNNDDKPSKEHIKYEDKGDVVVLFEGDMLMLDQDLDWHHMNSPPSLIPDPVTLPTTPEILPTAPPHEREKRDSVAEPTNWIDDHLWPNKRIPFLFDTYLGSGYRMQFIDAMELWEESTCLTFENAGLYDVDYLLFMEGNSCSSFVGRKGGPQTVIINNTCSEVGEIAHQLGHAIGLFHEHTRPDRDDYIQIIYDNVQRIEDIAYFEKRWFKLVPEVEYDIQSIMHFGPYAFGSNAGEKTIQIREDVAIEGLQCSSMGQRKELSYKDKIRTALLYSCDVDNIEPTMCITDDLPADEGATLALPSLLPDTATPLSPQLTKSRILSGNVIQLTLNDAEYVLACPSSSSECGRQHNNHIDSHHSTNFQIINHANISSRKIRSGNVVLFQSIKTKSMWLDCSNPRNCVLSKCEKLDNHDFSSHVSISDCPKHYFDIVGVNRETGKILNVNNKFRLRHHSSGSYLSCHDGDDDGDDDGRCTLLEGEIQNCRSLKGSDNGGGRSHWCDSIFTAVKI